MRLGGEFAERGAHLLFVVIAQDRQRHLSARLRAGDLIAQAVAVAHRRAVESDDDIAGAQPGAFSRTARSHPVDDDAAHFLQAQTGRDVGGDRLDRNAELPAPHLAALD